MAGLFHRNRVIHLHARATRQQRSNQVAARCFAHVVGVRLERQTPDGERAAGQVGTHAVFDLADQHFLLLVVDGLNGFQHVQRLTVLLRRAHQRLHVLRETRPAVAGAGVEEAVADTRVGTDAQANEFNVRAHLVGQIGHLVHERDARGQHRIGGVLGEFGGAHVHVERALMVAIERRVKRTHDGLGTQAIVIAIRAKHDAVRAHEVVHRGAFFQEFGVRHDREADVRLAARSKHFTHCSAHLVARSHRHRRFVDNHLEARHVLGDVAGGRQHVLQVGRAVFIGRRAHSDELHVAVRHAGSHVGRKLDAAGRAVTLDQLLQSRFVDGHAAGVEQVDLLLVDVETEHIVAQLRQTCAGD